MNALDWKRNFNYWFIFYIIYWVVLVVLLKRTIDEPNIWNIVGFILCLGIQVFNTFRIKKMKENISHQIKEEMLEKIEE